MLLAGLPQPCCLRMTGQSRSHKELVFASGSVVCLGLSWNHYHFLYISENLQTQKQFSSFLLSLCTCRLSLVCLLEGEGGTRESWHFLLPRLWTDHVHSSLPIPPSLWWWDRVIKSTTDIIFPYSSFSSAISQRRQFQNSPLSEILSDRHRDESR